MRLFVVRTQQPNQTPEDGMINMPRDKTADDEYNGTSGTSEEPEDTGWHELDLKEYEKHAEDIPR